MKNLFIYITPEKTFEHDEELSKLVKISIENSNFFGLDTVLVTNFDYEYHGVRATIVPDECFSSFKPTTTKLKTIIYMIENGMIDNDWYWFHDLDAFQLEYITLNEVLHELDGRNIGMTDYGRSSINRGRDKRWSTGTIFFNKDCKDFLDKWWQVTKLYKVNEEVSLLEMLKKERYKKYRDQITKIDITYNLGTRKRDVKYVYDMAKKPLKVVHFHPHDKRKLSLEDGDNLDVCMYGKSRIGKPLMTPHLIHLFNKHGIK